MIFHTQNAINTVHETDVLNSANFLGPRTNPYLTATRHADLGAGVTHGIADNKTHKDVRASTGSLCIAFSEVPSFFWRSSCRENLDL
jgi:hypothetical protein